MYFKNKAAVLLKIMTVTMAYMVGLFFFGTRMVLADVIFSPFELIGGILLSILPVIIGIVVIAAVTILLLHLRNKKKTQEKKEVIYKKDE